MAYMLVSVQMFFYFKNHREVFPAFHTSHDCCLLWPLPTSSLVLIFQDFPAPQEALDNTASEKEDAADSENSLLWGDSSVKGGGDLQHLEPSSPSPPASHCLSLKGRAE